jgi:hypothetical protein
MPKLLQRLLLLVGVVALLVVLIELGFSVAATTHGSTPVRIVHVDAGPYPLTVNLYKDPANAGYALPFSIAPQQGISGTLTYDVFSVPAHGIHATPVRAGLSPDANVHNGVQGTAEITVQGNWTLQITVTGPSGTSVADVPIVATAPPAIPLWLGWLIGLIPIYGLLAFLLTQRSNKNKSVVVDENVVTTPENVTPPVGA